ncbi:MAG: hypothetical protein K2P57_00400 [Burkholderiales bacterium]|nr:hypothetical protein [Burkholderiales bacterium]
MFAVIIETVSLLCLLLIAVFAEASFDDRRNRISFHSHPSCGEARCRYCMKLYKVWFTRY